MGTRRPRPRVIAHRGSPGPGIAENTLAAFEQAVAIGADMIELDVRRTADQELVIFHDCAVGAATIDSLSLPELRERSATDVPRLSEVLDWACGRIGLNVELKQDGYLARVVELLAEFADGGGELLVTSFLDPVLTNLGDLRLSSDRGLVIEFSAAGAVDRARECAAGFIVPQAELVTDALLDEALDADLQVLVWDFMAATRSHPELLHDPRIAGVITDDVPGALAARGSRSGGGGLGVRSGVDDGDPVGDDL